MEDDAQHDGWGRYGEALAALLAPVSPGEFLARHWEAAPLLISGPADKFAHLEFGAAALRGVFDDGWPSEAKAQYFDSDGEHAEVAIAADQAGALYDAGMTICVSGLEEAHPPFRELTAAVKAYLNLAEAFDVSCYWSPSGGGFGTHFDRQSILVVQLEGTKRWRYSPSPALRYPGENFSPLSSESPLWSQAFPWLGSGVEVPPDGELLEAELTPGDALYLPAGTWHGTRAGEMSLALTLTFFHRDFTSLLGAVLASELGRYEDWRAPFPLVALDDAPVHGLPGAVEEFLAARLVQLKAAVDKLEPADFTTAWRRAVSRYRYPLRFDGSGTAAAGPVGIDDVLMAPEPVFCATVGAETGPGSLEVYFGDRRITLPVQARPFVEGLALHRRFKASEARGFGAGDPGWDEVATALEALLACGLLVRGN